MLIELLELYFLGSSPECCTFSLCFPSPIYPISLEPHLNKRSGLFISTLNYMRSPKFLHLLFLDNLPWIRSIWLHCITWTQTCREMALHNWWVGPTPSVATALATEPTCQAQGFFHLSKNNWSFRQNFLFLGLSSLPQSDTAQTQ